MAKQVRLGSRFTRARRARQVAIAASAAAAALYFLIGLQVVSIGEATSGGTADLLGFGLAAAGFFGALALLMVFAQGRLVWIPMAIADLAVISAYFATADVRAPRFEAWGLATKAMQLVLLGALGYLIYHGRVRPSTG